MARNGPHIQKYTPGVLKRLLTGISQGATRTLACKFAGIDIDTLIIWEKKYPELKAQVLEAEGIAAVGWLAKIEKAASDGVWTAAAWKLERLYRNEYGKAVQDQHNTNLNVNAEELARLSDAEFDLLYQRAHGDRG